MMREGKRSGRRWIVPIAVVVVLLAVTASLYAAQLYPFQRDHSGGGTLAPNFSLTDIYGHNFTLSDYRGNSVVVIEFTSLSCSECQIVEQSLATLYGSYNRSGSSPVHVISVYIEPNYGDSISALRSYHNQNNITWTMAQDTPNLEVTGAYGVGAIPVVVIVDKQGHAVYDVSGAQSTSQLESTTASALQGRAAGVSIVTVSVFALAAVAGLSTFFSPCAFPMFPGYMGLFLGLNTNRDPSAPTSSVQYGRAVRRAASAGTVAAIGMLVVFLLVGVALIFAASLVGSYIPYFLIVVGVALVALGFLLLTNLQYWKVVAPFQTLWRHLRGTGATEPSVAPASADGKGFYLKLFSYGMGYAAAAAGCVAPVILSAIVAGMALGLLSGIISILIYSLTAALLMVVVTIMIGMAGERYVNQLKAYTPVIKKFSAVVLVVVGVYLIYYYYTAWIV